MQEPPEYDLFPSQVAIYAGVFNPTFPQIIGRFMYPSFPPPGPAKHAGPPQLCAAGKKVAEQFLSRKHAQPSKFPTTRHNHRARDCRGLSGLNTLVGFSPQRAQTPNPQNGAVVRGSNNPSSNLPHTMDSAAKVNRHSRAGRREPSFPPTPQSSRARPRYPGPHSR